MKFLIFDAGPIISLTMSGLLGVLRRLKEIFEGEFVITPQVTNEVVSRPLKIKKYELEAIQVKKLIDDGILKKSSLFVQNDKLEKETCRILMIANSTLTYAKSKEKINLIHEGEASCLAFSNLCSKENVIVIDERTTRMLIEAPKNLKELMERKLHDQLSLDFSKLNSLKNFKFIRSSELLFLAYEKGLLPFKKGRQTLDALLYGVKFKGTAISSAEIEEMKSMV
ncbi:hypothetical protein D6829_00655 [Candidatus Pacearchaeota archaeon]|nr:MAG: hypothetical protein D6829_00655 [Candidatus Pacearchaeota archaeon]